MKKLRPPLIKGFKNAYAGRHHFLTNIGVFRWAPPLLVTLVRLCGCAFVSPEFVPRLELVSYVCPEQYVRGGTDSI